ncbi:MAG: hypothetical protein QW343_03880 [Candidatus Norongarragalinales archaeon]
MTEIEKLTPQEAYIEGRLMGLSELISILKDSMESPEGEASNAIFKSIVLHISNEMDSIISELKGAHGEAHPVLRAAEKKAAQIEQHAERVAAASPAKAPQALKKPLDVSDDLMKSLQALREESGESEVTEET